MSMGSGLLVVDKPQGVTSHDVVAAVRRVLHTKHVGHAGTLDPMATGVLVVGFGSATRLLNYIVGSDKTYETTIRLGRSTTTDDADGEFLPLSVGEYTTTADVVPHFRRRHPRGGFAPDRRYHAGAQLVFRQENPWAESL